MKLNTWVIAITLLKDITAVRALTEKELHTGIFWVNWDILSNMALILVDFIFSIPIHKLFWLISNRISLVITVFFPLSPISEDCLSQSYWWWFHEFHHYPIHLFNFKPNVDINYNWVHMCAIFCPLFPFPSLQLIYAHLSNGGKLLYHCCTPNPYQIQHHDLVWFSYSVCPTLCNSIDFHD